VVAAVGAALILLTGLFTIVRGRHWPVMSGRYERDAGPSTRAGSRPAPPHGPPAAGQEQGFPEAKVATRPSARSEDPPARRDTGHRAMWDALDRGEDPTD
jgi:hypothetical protein